MGLPSFLFPIANFRRPHLDSIEIHVADHCNLNCKGCSVCSPLTKVWFCDVVQTEKDLLELSRKIQFARIALIGGETLLHPELTELVQIVRKAYPKVRVDIVTNGILLPKMSSEFWTVCRENEVFLCLSMYPPFRRNENTYLDLAKDEKVRMILAKNDSVWNKITCSFHRDKSSADAHFRVCEQKNCHKLWHSKLYLCPACFLQHYNRYFNENHETVRGYDIYKYSGKELQQFMTRPDPACRYCTWVMKKEITQWDYSKREKSEWCEGV